MTMIVQKIFLKNGKSVNCRGIAGHDLLTDYHLLVMIDIPNEIWLSILEFIPDRELCHLMAVNRVFYELALDTRYREITIGPIDSHSVSLLKRLQSMFPVANI